MDNENSFRRAFDHSSVDGRINFDLVFDMIDLIIMDLMVNDDDDDDVDMVIVLILIDT